MLQAAVFSFSEFFAIRSFLGFFEAYISPAWILLTSMLWTREEQPLRTSFWLSMNRLSSILGALLSYGLGHAADGLTVLNWKLIDLVSALVAVYGVSCWQVATGGGFNDYGMGICDLPISPRRTVQRKDVHKIRANRCSLANLPQQNWNETPQAPAILSQGSVVGSKNLPTSAHGSIARYFEWWWCKFPQYSDQGFRFQYAENFAFANSRSVIWDYQLYCPRIFGYC